MKKYIVPIVIAVVLIIGAIVAVVLINKNRPENAEVSDDNYRPLTEEEIYPSDVEVKSGTYYLNGDRNSDLWVEVNPDFLILKGDDVDASIRNAIVERATENEAIEEEISDAKILYCTEKVYTVSHIGIKDVPYCIHVSRDNTESDPEKLIHSNAGFPYNPDTNTIRLSLFGNFTLAE